VPYAARVFDAGEVRADDGPEKLQVKIGSLLGVG
jgi:hypothetical protein